MPKYTFECPTCAHIAQLFVPKDIKEVLCKECDSDIESLMYRRLPKIAGQEVLEVVDALTNTKWKQDHQEIVSERSEDYYWSVEVPRFVESGTYLEETMLEQGWIYYDEKGHMQIHTKPPGRR